MFPNFNSLNSSSYIIYKTYVRSHKSHLVVTIRDGNDRHLVLLAPFVDVEVSSVLSPLFFLWSDLVLILLSQNESRALELVSLGGSCLHMREHVRVLYSRAHNTWRVTRNYYIIWTCRNNGPHKRFSAWGISAWFILFRPLSTSTISCWVSLPA